MNDVFTPDLFSTTSLTAAIDKVPFIPGAVSRLGLFNEIPVATTSVVIEKRGNSVALVPSAKRGASGQTTTQAKRTGYSFIIPHLPARDAIYADEVQNVREFGTDNQLAAVESVRDMKLETMARDLDFTNENHRLGAIQGRVYDADGSTVLFDLWSIFSDSEPAEIDFDLDAATPASGAVRIVCNQVIYAIEAALDGIPFSGVHAFVGSTFWDQLTAHKEIRETYLNQVAASELRGDASGKGGDEIFSYGGIDWQRYRGRGAVTPGATKARFMPKGVPNLFQTAFGPADYMETVNTLGLSRYAKAEPMKFGKGLELEAQSNPLNICTIPAVLQRAKNT